MNPVIISLEGEYDLHRCQALDEELAPTLNASSVIIDLTKVEYADSTCLGALVKIHKEREAKGFDVEMLVIASPMLRRIFEITSLDAVWPIFPTLAEAIASLSATDAEAVPQ